MPTTVLTSFERWKQFLSERVHAAEHIGLSEDRIISLASQIGDFLSNNVDPKTEQDRLLKDLWSVADESEQRTIARLIVKLVSDGKK